MKRGLCWVIELEQLVAHARQYGACTLRSLVLPAFGEGRIWKWDVVAEMTHLLLLVTSDGGELMRGRYAMRKDIGRRFDVKPRVRMVGLRP